MAIQVQCECGLVSKAPDDAIGKRGVCPGCQRKFTIEAKAETQPKKKRKPPKKPRPPTSRQVVFAIQLGLYVPQDMTFDEIASLLSHHEEARWYVCDVWEALTGKRPKDSYIPSEDVASLATEIVKNLELAERISEIQDSRNMAMYEAADADCEKHGYNTKDFAEYKPIIQRDATFNSVEELLRNQWKQHFPREGFLSWLFG